MTNTTLPLPLHSPLSSSGAGASSPFSYSVTRLICYFCADAVSKGSVPGAVIGGSEEGAPPLFLKSDCICVPNLFCNSARANTKAFSLAKCPRLPTAPVPQAEGPGLPGALLRTCQTFQPQSPVLTLPCPDQGGAGVHALSPTDAQLFLSPFRLTFSVGPFLTPYLKLQISPCPTYLLYLSLHTYDLLTGLSNLRSLCVTLKEEEFSWAIH